MQRPHETITSRQNPLIMLVASLAERKYREREGLFRFDGKKLFFEALQAELPLRAVLLRTSSAEKILAEAGDFSLPDDCRLVHLPDELFLKISEEKSPDGVICVSSRLDKIHKIITINEKEAWEEALSAGNTIVLESVRDPGNLGTVIRSAGAFGMANVVLSGDCADLYNPRTIRAAMGVLFHQRVLIAENICHAIEALRARGRVYAATLDANAFRLGAVSLGANDALVVGNEGHGLSEETVKACGHSIYIPMQRGVESLNAGVAASVLMYELSRGR